jgi:hypothetical protein
MGWLGILVGVLSFVGYWVMAAGAWFFMAVADGAFVGEGDGFNRRQRWQRIGEALLWPWWALLILGKTCQRWFLAAVRR